VRFSYTCLESSELKLFDEIFIDIGDEQSIDNDLSTYSSHLNNMRMILEEATEKSLVLIDEFGAGTEPTAGGAIAEAILTEIEQKGVLV
jgi:DNA mismatch repair protein MutS2